MVLGKLYYGEKVLKGRAMTVPQIKKIRIESIQAGKVKPLGPGNHLSGIDKRPLSGPVNVSATGVEGDEQADRKHHGGPEMAVHHYPLEHYDAWRREYPAKVNKFAHNGAFGENISARGMTEENVCIGDVYKVGTTRLQVSQARQPCWKLNASVTLALFARPTVWYPCACSTSATVSTESPRMSPLCTAPCEDG